MAVSAREKARARCALGLMSGTSMDGVDAAILATDGETLGEFGPTLFRPYCFEEQELVSSALDAAPGLADRTARPPALAAAEAAIEAAHIAAVSEILAQAGLAPKEIDVIGFHGHTVLHDPARHLTVQIGNGGRIARATGIDVVWDMRAADMAAGGQGAPLAPAFHRALAEASGIALPGAIVNIGGVANVTWLGADGAMLAFDCGPGNALIDDLVRELSGGAMDEGGHLAARGKVDVAVLARLMAHPYFQAPPPKSLDRKSFSREAVAGLGLEDAAATLTAFTAETIAAAATHMPAPPRIWILSGGGARNPVLVAAVRARTEAPVKRAGVVGWSEDFIEAQAFAYLAVRSLRGLPLTFPGTTGVPEPLTGGRVSRAEGRP
jgi:anhydro-N-acetylmuramic acid kinase